MIGCKRERRDVEGFERSWRGDLWIVGGRNVLGLWWRKLLLGIVGYVISRLCFWFRWRFYFIRIKKIGWILYKRRSYELIVSMWIINFEYEIWVWEVGRCYLWFGV